MPSGTVLSAAPVTEPESGRAVLQLITDAPIAERAIYVDPQDPHPALGDRISWTTGHVTWGDRRLRKRGYAFDPDAPLT